MPGIRRSSLDDVRCKKVTYEGHPIKNETFGIAL